MASYRVVARTLLHPPGYLSPRLFRPGEIVQYDGIPGSSLQPLDGAARQAFANMLRGGSDQASKASWANPQPGEAHRTIAFARAAGAPADSTFEECREFLLAFEGTHASAEP